MENIKTCIILCGGMSRRMGKDKGSMILNNKPMILHILDTLNHRINEVYIVLNNQDRIAYYKKFIDDEYSFDIFYLEDEIKNKGPLSGIYTGLKNIKSQYSLVLPCDSPYVSGEFIDLIFDILDMIKSENIDEIKNNYSSIIPYGDNTDMESKIKSCEPLHAVYDKRLVNLIENLLKEDILDIKSLIRQSNSLFIDKKSLKISDICFKNINSEKDIN